MSSRWLLVVLIAVGTLAVACLRLDFSAMPETKVFRDDAYYYFDWARSLAAGGGACVSQGIPTSGLHPLWGLGLAACAWLFGAASLPFVAQVLGLLLHAATACLLYPRCGGSRAWRVACLLLYLGNPLVLSEAQNGQETALCCFVLALLLRHARGSEARFAALSVLLVLARSDLFLLLPFLSLWRHGLRPRAMLSPALALACYGGINLALAGHLLQDSAWPMAWLFSERYLQHPEMREARLWWWLRPCLLGGPYGFVSPVLGGVLLFAAVHPIGLLRGRGTWLFLLTLLAGLLGAADLSVPLIGFGLLAVVGRGRVEQVGLATPLLLGFGPLVFLHEVLRHYPRVYYFVPLAVAGILALAYLRRESVRLAWLAALVCAILNLVMALAPRAGWPWHEEISMSGRFMRRIVGEREPIGCFNAGIAIWRHPGRVVNLDGVVNREAFVALQSRRLDAYLDRLGIRFLLDVSTQFARDSRWPHASGRYFGKSFVAARDLREIARFTVPGVVWPTGGEPASWGLYWRVGHGPAPVLPEKPADLGPAPGGGRYVLWPGREGQSLRVAPLSGAVPPVPLARGREGVVRFLRVDPPAPGAYGLFVDRATTPVLVLEDS